MKPQHESFLTTDGVTIFFRAWVPSAPAGIAILSHGYAEHSGRYQHVVDRLLGENLAVYALDHRGHGNSGGQQGFIADIGRLVDDLAEFIDLVQSLHPDQRTILFAHSMGSALALWYVADHPGHIDVLIASAPYLIDGGNASPLLVRLSRLLAICVPRLPVKAIDSAQISRDPQVVRDYDSDPLNCRDPIRVRTGVELLSLGPAVFARADQITIPILILHGDGDAIAASAGSRQLYQSVGSSDKTLKIYPDLYHEVLNEPEQDQILNEIVDWLKLRVQAGN